MPPIDVALVGPRALAPPEDEFNRESGGRVGGRAVAEAIAGAAGAYVAVDVDVLDPAEAVAFMPEPGGLTLAEAETVLRDVSVRTRILGAGLSGLAPDPANVRPLERLCAALGL